MQTLVDTWAELNLNETVWVRLSDYGREVFRTIMENRNAGFKEMFPGYPIDTLYALEPDVDASGYSRFQLYELMELFGPYLKLGDRRVFEDGTIILPQDKLKPSNQP